MTLLTAIPREARRAEGRLLPEGRKIGPMPWVIAIMMFLTVLTAAAGLALFHGAQSLQADLAGRITLQVVDADMAARDALARKLVDGLQDKAGIAQVVRVPDAQIAALLAPYLGAHVDAALPIPAMIDVALDAGHPEQGMTLVEAIARGHEDRVLVQRHQQFLAPLAGLMHMLVLLSIALMLMMAGATGATIVLAARGALNSHRSTIEVLHLMGATDVQVARLFQRRIALDALLGAGAGFVLAILLLILIGGRMAAIGSDLLGAVRLPIWGWPLLILLPIACVLLSAATARGTVLKALRKML